MLKCMFYFFIFGVQYTPPKYNFAPVLTKAILVWEKHLVSGYKKNNT